MYTRNKKSSGSTKKNKRKESENEQKEKGSTSASAEKKKSFLKRYPLLIGVFLFIIVLIAAVGVYVKKGHPLNTKHVQFNSDVQHFPKVV